jgi:hypothetical protein
VFFLLETPLTLNLGIFELIAAIMIFVMGVTMLKMDRGKPRWPYFNHSFE